MSADPVARGLVPRPAVTTAGPVPRALVPRPSRATAELGRGTSPRATAPGERPAKPAGFQPAPSPRHSPLATRHSEPTHHSSLLLALDTSTATASLALFDGQLLSETTWRAGREHSSQLMLELDRTLERLGKRTADLTAVAAAIGPGSFTGVRVGVALAKGLAFALDLPAYGISSLDVLAAAQESTDLPVRPLLEAGRGRFATALYQPGPDGLERRTPIEGVTLDDLPRLVQQPTLLCGDLSAEARQQLADRLGPLARLASPAASLRRAGFLAHLASRRYQSGERPSPQGLEPVYLGGQFAT